ncbi:MAG: potassium channel family protein [Candidatus Hydrothermarchaeales archaeon]
MAQNLKDMLVEMKDISELMVDLAYSTVLLDNVEIAEEVSKLEERMNKLNYEIRIMAMVGARDIDDAEQLTGILQIASAAESISNAARAVVDVVLRDIELHPIIKEALAEAEEKITKVEVLQDSILVDHTLGESKLGTNIGMQVIAVRRGTEWIYGPDKNTLVKTGDTLIARGRETGIELLEKVANGEKRWLYDHMETESAGEIQ